MDVLILRSALAAAAAGVIGAAAPAQTPIAWSTYLRNGPGETYTAVSELEHDTRVTVLGCTGGWCRVSGDTLQGWVDRDALALPRTSAPKPPVDSGCVTALLKDNRRPMATRFCSAAPPTR